MFHYLFTNDLRISNLESFLREAGKCFANDCVPNAAEDKNANNNMNTLGFYFNLTKESNCSKECESGNIRRVVLNFIKKFQFPNPRTSESLNQALEDGITIAPMRVILQSLYILNMVDPIQAYLTREEIAEYIFFNENIAKKPQPNMISLVETIIKRRATGEKSNIMSDEELEGKGIYWKQCKRQVREMVKVLCWSGCVRENDNGSITIHHESLTSENKADLFEILTYKGRWVPEANKSFHEHKQSYQKFMDVELEYGLDEIISIDEYQRAAKIIKDYIIESGFVFEENVDKIKQFYDEFKLKFSIENLMAIPDSELLTSMFYSSNRTNDSLCYWLEFNQQSILYGGGIAGGSSYKFGLFQRKEDNVWISGSPNKPEELSDEKALKIGKAIRDALIRGAKIIETIPLNNLYDYEKLDDILNKEIGKYASMGWVHKYFCLIYPDKLSAYHSFDWQKHILYGLKIKPSGYYYGRSGQVSIIRRIVNLEYCHFFEIVYDKFGGLKKFYGLSTVERDINYAEEWKKQGTIAIGCDSLGNLNEFVVENEINKKAISERLQEIYYKNDPQMALRKAGELVAFYKSNSDTIFVTMNRDMPLALVDRIGEYFFIPDKSMSHRKAGTWHNCFDIEEKMPNKPVGLMTSCYELNDDENLLYLYDKYYYDLTDRVKKGRVEEMEEFATPVYNTRLNTKFERNRIVFGAPGTGKSFMLKEDSIELLEGTLGSLERVTFHPDYAYSQFVGTYKPVSDTNGNIRYKFVPGPFMRVYVEAVRSGRSDNPQPHLLLIEEINRARVAAVFGDIFQLLDRDENGVSEYEIQTTEDVRKYLTEALGGHTDNYKIKKIPNNMFIWATMNSADQGVYPMDAAFKRRWHFQYIGIDDSDDKVENYIIPVGKEEARRYIYWNQLRKSINNILANECRINEDKLLGPFFLSKDLLKNALENRKTENLFIKAFESKLIMYLFEDVMKMKPQMIFKGHANKNGKMIFSEICKAFEDEGEAIFDLDLPNAKPQKVEE